MNLGVVETILPTTGITLPLVSYGGSSMVASCILLGLILSVGATRPTVVLHGETFTGRTEA
ncbi:MAG: FtsW/RodA/SpoVE family cell cycle protein [Planctomycetota bacterium]